MHNTLKKVGEWLANAVKDALMAPIDDLRQDVARLTKAQEELAKKVENKHAGDPAALECDLSLLDERICYLIGKCREKGYTTASDRRIIDRLHQAYQSRGGNHGEENEYAIYRNLPTEEEWRRNHAQDYLIR